MPDADRCSTGSAAEDQRSKVQDAADALRAVPADHHAHGRSRSIGGDPGARGEAMNRDDAPARSVPRTEFDASEPAYYARRRSASGEATEKKTWGHLACRTTCQLT